MRRTVSVLAVGALLAALMVVMTAPAFAEDQGCGVTEFARDATGPQGGGPYEGPGERPTVGDTISDGIYGNEPGIEGPFAPGGPSEQEPGTVAGRVEPTPSPGPFVNTGPNEPPRNDRVRGRSVGEFNQQFGCAHNQG